MGFTNPAVAAAVVTVSGIVGVNSAPSGAVPVATVASLTSAPSPAVPGTFNILPALFFGEYLLDSVIVTLLNPLQAANLTLTLATEPFGGGTPSIIAGPFYAEGTTGTNTPYAYGVQGHQFDLGQLVVPAGIDIDVIITGGSTDAVWAVNLLYTFSSGGTFPGHIISA